jgi:type I restriction enzyme R subunit
VVSQCGELRRQSLRYFPVPTRYQTHYPHQVEIFEWWKKLPRQRQPVIILLVDRDFQPAFDTLSERENIVVIADEAHRTQYGFKAKTIDDKDEQGNVVGKKVVYGFAKYMRDALPNATGFGFLRVGQIILYQLIIQFFNQLFAKSGYSPISAR